MALWLGIVAALLVLWAVLNKIREAYGMRMVTCVIRPEQLNDVTAALRRAKLTTGMTVMDVRGFGRQRGERRTERPHDIEAVRLLPKLKLEILVRNMEVEQTMETIRGALHTGQIGDGKLIVFKAAGAMRVRTGETGIDAV